MQKKENALEDVVLVAGTQQNLSNLYSLDINGKGTLQFTVYIRIIIYTFSSVA